MSLKYLDSTGAQALVTEIKTRLATKQNVMQFSSAPTLTTADEGKIFQWIGATAGDYVNGDFYKVVVESGTASAVKLTYNKSEVDALVAASGGKFIAVATLPSSNIDTGAIYLVPKTKSVTGYRDASETNGDLYVPTGTTETPKYDKYEYDNGDTMKVYVYDSEITGEDAATIAAAITAGTLTSTTVNAQTREINNVKDEYISTDGTSAGWEKIGDTEIDLSNYVQFSDLVPITSSELEAMWS